MIEIDGRFDAIVAPMRAVAAANARSACCTSGRRASSDALSVSGTRSALTAAASEPWRSMLPRRLPISTPGCALSSQSAVRPARSLPRALRPAPRTVARRVRTDHSAAIPLAREIECGASRCERTLAIARSWSSSSSCKYPVATSLTSESSTARSAASCDAASAFAASASAAELSPEIQLP